MTSRRFALATALLCGLLALLAFLPSILQNGVFLGRDDFLNQQIPFIVQSKRLLLAHGFNQWDWTIFLGADFIASYSFYNLGSPFFWMLLPWPDSAMLWGITVAAIAKHVVAGLGAFLYLKPFVREPRAAMLGALLYVFSGFTIVNVDFNHFTDVVALFPWLLWLLERTLHGVARPGPLALLVLLTISTNYYFAVSSLLFVLCYLYWHPASCHAKRNAILEMGAGVLLAGVWLVPIALSILDTPRVADQNLLLRLFKPLFPTNYLERIRVLLMPIESTMAHPFFPKTYSWTSTALYLPVIGLVFAWSFVRVSRDSWLTKFLLFLALVSLVPPLTGLFSLGTNPEYTRWWYAFALMLALASILALDNAMARGAERALKYARIMALLALLLSVPFLLLHAWYWSGSMPLGPLAGFVQMCYEKSTWGRPGLAYVALGLAAINYAALFHLLYNYRKMGIFPWNRAIAWVGVCAVLNYGTVIYWNNNSLYPVEGYPDPGLAYYQRVLVENPATSRPMGPILQRIDYPILLENFGTWSNRPSVRTFHSVRTRALGAFAEAAGMGPAISPAARPSDADSALRALLSVGEFRQYDAAHADSVRPFPYRLPFGFAYAYYDSLPVDSGVFISERMLAALLVGDSGAGALRGFLRPLPDSLRNLGWKEHVQLLRYDTCTNFATSPHGFLARIALTEKRIVFFSVPYHPGWSAFLDGQPVAIEKTQIAFMGLRVPPGEHDLRFVYNMPGQMPGWVFSLLGLLLLIGLRWWRGGENLAVRKCCGQSQG